jgi:hypothetical protein
LSLGLGQNICASSVVGGREVFTGGIGGAIGSYVALKFGGRIASLVVTGFRRLRGGIGLITTGTRRRAQRIGGPRGLPVIL